MSIVVSTPRKYKTLDAWRGAASLWVVMYHVAEVIVRRHPQMSSNLLIKFSLFGALGVQVFFVISGYCIANALYRSFLKDEVFYQFMRARVKRIYPPLWFATGLTILVSLAASLLISLGRLHSSTLATGNIFHHGWLYLISNLTLTSVLFNQPMIVGQAWTLCYEAAFYLIMGLILIVTIRTKNEQLSFNCLHSLTILSLAVLAFSHTNNFYPMDLWAQFGLGVLLYDYLSHPEQTRPKLWLALVSLMLLGFAVQPTRLIGYAEEPSRLTYLFSLVFTGYLIVIHRYDEKATQNPLVRLFSWLGLFSYSLYLTHPIFVGITSQAVKVLHMGSVIQYVFFFVTIFVSIVFAYLFFVFCERPFLNSKRSVLRQEQTLTTSGKV